MSTPVTLASLLDPSNHSSEQHRATELARSDYKFMADLVRQRKAAGLTQEDVAQRLGIAQPTVAKFERYDSDPKLSTIRRYAHAIGALVGHSVRPDVGDLGEGVRSLTVSFSVGGIKREVGSYAVPGGRTDFSLAA